ncbi:MAG: patatin-like phospholipase family protein [Spirochaetes bacterium]|nr:MAG: patatin-like phospholipase family protein [Spirochaetota bacterium]
MEVNNKKNLPATPFQDDFRGMNSELKIGLALGGGGARGLAHLSVLEVFDEMGIRPNAISGASIGAIVGALYASGISARDIRDYVDSHLQIKKEDKPWKIEGRNLMQMVKLLDLDFSGNGLIKGENFSHFLYEILEIEDFSDLQIPLKVVAADFWDSSEVVYDSGPVLPAVKASMSVPGVFTPVTYQGRVLVDGACVNPVPWNHLNDCDVIIGVNVLGRLQPSDSLKPPKAAKVVLETFEVMQRTILAQRLCCNPPDLLLNPPITGVGIFDFHKAKMVYRQSEGIVQELRDFLEKIV